MIGVIVDSLQLNTGSTFPIPFVGILAISIGVLVVFLLFGFLYKTVAGASYSEHVVDSCISASSYASVLTFLILCLALVVMHDAPHAENVELFEKAYGVEAAAFVPVDDRNVDNIEELVSQPPSDGAYEYTYVTSKSKKKVTVKLNDDKLTMVGDHGVIRPNGKGI